MEPRKCICTWNIWRMSDGEMTQTIEKWNPECEAHSLASVLIFKGRGKYYTKELWRIPKDAIGPYDMERSPDNRWSNEWHILVETQEPWGFPYLFPAGGS